MERIVAIRGGNANSNYGGAQMELRSNMLFDLAHALNTTITMHASSSLSGHGNMRVEYGVAQLFRKKPRSEAYPAKERRRRRSNHLAWSQW